MGTLDPAVALIGAGAIGISLASAFARVGRPVVVCGGRVPIDRIELELDGHRASWPVRHTTSPDDLETLGQAIIAVKAHQTGAVAEWVRALARPSVTILVAQNGVEHRDRVVEFAGSATIVPAIVYLNAERTAPGRVTCRRVRDPDVAVRDDEAGRAWAYALAAGGVSVGMEADFLTAAWSKLLMNVTANPLTAITGRTAEVMREPGIAPISKRILVEAVRVAQAEGAALADSDVESAMQRLQGFPKGLSTSMLQDRLAGRPMEYDALTGAVLRSARRHGIDVPTNELIFALLTAIEAGHMPVPR